MEKVRVAIIGATGYTASESIRLLLAHPQAEITYLTALPEECAPLEQVFPGLKGRLSLPIEPIDLDKLAEQADVALCCLPHRVSMGFVPKLLSAGVKVVDFSADYRLHDVALYEQVYKVDHVDPEHIDAAAFGLPELFRQTIPSAKLVANPGCYPTAASLAVAPLANAGAIDCEDIIVNAVSGASGAGRKAALAFHFPEMNENLFGYAVGTHRHQPEIDQILSEHSGRAVRVLFQPHVVSIDRGIAETIYVKPTRTISPDELMAMYQQAYADEPFVRVLDRPGQLKHIAGTNFVDVFPTMVGDRIVIFATIDNLVKGASGQAVQNMNIICGFEETMGLL